MEALKPPYKGVAATIVGVSLMYSMQCVRYEYSFVYASDRTWMAY